MNLLNITVWSDDDKFISAILNSKGEAEFIENEDQFYFKLFDAIKHHPSFNNAINGRVNNARVSTRIYK